MVSAFIVIVHKLTLTRFHCPLNKF
ncbi:hypothetical protein [Bacillus sp. es.034]